MALSIRGLITWGLKWSVFLIFFPLLLTVFGSILPILGMKLLDFVFEVKNFQGTYNKGHL
jgi:hypothetical protein